MPLLVRCWLVDGWTEERKEGKETMEENDQKKRGFLYHWANEEETIKRIPCEVYSRVVGYYRPVRNWNVGKQQEWEDRKVYDLPKVHQKVIE